MNKHRGSLFSDYLAEDLKDPEFIAGLQCQLDRLEVESEARFKRLGRMINGLLVLSAILAISTRYNGLFRRSQ